ncbi:gamma-glutamyl-gamma-aminobutyrate hydrolase family protein [Nocardioides carbamazepini]|uniref:gamma-glutamyl-gamma-aminobutyrate hydrolase family protein n=1 Tax=Nocardioides carbamazepini TaxID=2854259 RepID=UPI00214A2AA0|nr:gamma-glutamyl-gamma-aminobutyrate hydrolase family protein [Nocardioides carbamazepini]MCR1785006.1 gamma-glutamyl-gamma-aminobutyrate hydrolase family protein [Nocardioides carbamazepini]
MSTTTWPLVLITQRALRTGPDNVLHDALDRRWYDFARAWGITLGPIPNEPPRTESGRQAAGLILSGGGDLAVAPGAGAVDAEREDTEARLIAEARSLGRPILGVCRGAQRLWADAGGRLALTSGHGSGMHDIVPTAAGSAIGMVRTQVNSFHAYRLAGHAAGTQVLATARTGTGLSAVVEAFLSSGRLEWGVMWHPERPLNGPEATRGPVEQFVAAVRNRSNDTTESSCTP